MDIAAPEDLARPASAPERTTPADTLIAGIAERNASLFRRVGVALGDPAASLRIGGRHVLLVRDLEMDRVRRVAAAELVTCPAEQLDAATMSGDRETATAQAVAALLSRHGVDRVRVDRTLPFIYAQHLMTAGITPVYDAELGVRDRRQKTAAEIDSLQKVQSLTERVMQRLCECIADATPDRHGHLVHNGEPLTSESIRATAAIEFLKLGCTMTHGAIVATAPQAADCHHAGSGPLLTGRPIIVDLFPRCETSRYWGDCTRTVVHGDVDQEVVRMHAAVIAAKTAATSAMIAGTSAAGAHAASEQTLLERGYVSSRGVLTEDPSIQHGTGHGIGLDLHEPILLDHGGGEMLDNEVFTVEPGLYGRRSGGVRVEDMIVVTRSGAVNLNRLPTGLDWRTQ